MQAPNILTCVHCRSSRLVAADRHLDCADCGTSYPVLGGVPVLFDDVEILPGSRPDAVTARQILGAFGLPEDAISIQRIRELFAQKARFGGLLIETEAAQFLDRIRNTGHDVGSGSSTAANPGSGRVSTGKAQPRWIKSYIPRLLPTDQELLANVRFENIGTGTMHHDGVGRTAIAARWLDSDSHAVTSIPDTRTPLPIDLPPGRALTLPVRIRTPERAGRYSLVLLMVEEGVRWLDADVMSVPVQISGNPLAAAPPGWWLRDELLPDYQADHRRGVALLRDWLDAHAPGQPRILEIGGNAIPMIEDLPGELYNVDVDLLGLQICRLRQRHARRAMTILCADADNLPFPPGFFDVIVVFASLHHFPDPAALLGKLRSRLKPEGFIGLFCEPVGHIWPGDVPLSVRAELERGVNEQSFTPDEYARIFRLAELETAEAIVDKNSLKARLMARSVIPLAAA